jgi:hypothetical protein
MLEECIFTMVMLACFLYVSLCLSQKYLPLKYSPITCCCTVLSLLPSSPPCTPSRTTRLHHPSSRSIPRRAPYVATPRPSCASRCCWCCCSPLKSRGRCQRRGLPEVDRGCCKSRSGMLHMLQVFQRHVASISEACSKCFICSRRMLKVFWFGCCICFTHVATICSKCFSCFSLMLQWVFSYVASCKCFIWMLHMFYTYVASVYFRYFICFRMYFAFKCFMLFEESGT